LSIIDFQADKIEVYDQKLIPEEISKHLMGHKLKDRVRVKYFLVDPDDLMKTYFRYIEYITIKKNSYPVSLDEFKQLKG
jgi:hypothetical protein